MAEPDEIHREIVGHSVKGVRRVIRLTRGQPGRIVVTIYSGKATSTIVVTADNLREALDRLDPR